MKIATTLVEAALLRVCHQKFPGVVADNPPESLLSLALQVRA
jgi:hypothetical protein